MKNLLCLICLQLSLIVVYCDICPSLVVFLRNVNGEPRVSYCPPVGLGDMLRYRKNCIQKYKMAAVGETLLRFNPIDRTAISFKIAKYEKDTTSHQLNLIKVVPGEKTATTDWAHVATYGLIEAAATLCDEMPSKVNLGPYKIIDREPDIHWF